jgi:hypothetical protein
MNDHFDEATRDTSVYSNAEDAENAEARRESIFSKSLRFSATSALFALSATAFIERRLIPAGMNTQAHDQGAENT